MTFSMFVLTILAAAIGGLLQQLASTWPWWRLMSYATFGGAALAVPLLVLEYSVLTTNWFVDVMFATALACVFSALARYPSRTVRCAAFLLPTSILLVLVWISMAMGIPNSLSGLASVYPLIYVASSLVLMPIVLVVELRRQPTDRRGSAVTWDLQPGL